MYICFSIAETIFFVYCGSYPESLDLCYGVTCAFFLRAAMVNFFGINVFVVGLLLFIKNELEGKKSCTFTALGYCTTLYFFLCFKAWSYLASYLLNAFTMLIELAILGTLGTHSGRIFGITGIAVGGSFLFGLWTLTCALKIKTFIESKRSEAVTDKQL